MNRMFFAVLAALILFILAVVCSVVVVFLHPVDAQARYTAPEETQIVEAAYDPAWDIPASEPAACDDVFLGEYTLTAYCPCARCCGKSDGITATGTLAAEGRTIAVDPRVIPYGSRVLLIWPDGTQHTYIAEDCGSGINGNRIDVYLSDHETARVFGVQSAMAYLTKEDAP